MKCQVDHFSFTNNHSFKLKYLVNDTFWNHDGGPIFFYTGNEGPIETFAENTGFMWEIAPEFSALLVFAEHRYYGASLPYGNKSLSDLQYLGYLSSQQALADYVDLISHLKMGLSGAAHSAVIAFGGSYGGMLSAWFRMKYPYVVDGSIASSAPIWQFSGLTPCNVFARIVTSDFTMESEECSKSVRKSWGEIDSIAKSAAGKQWLSETLKLCQPLQTSVDVQSLKDWLREVYTDLAMVDYPYAANFLKPLPGHPISVVCRSLANSSASGKMLLKMLSKGLNVYFNYTGKEKCVNLSNVNGAVGSDAWDFQSCTEMVMPMCNDGVEDMFEPAKWDLSTFSDECYKKWKVRPQPDLAIKEYGGKRISTASNIVFSNGLLDPWAGGGVLLNVSETAVAVLIPEGAHHLDLRASDRADPPAVRLARDFHRRSIRRWCSERLFLSSLAPPHARG
ncbi:lysosomal Pro-X carboxypeptidase isoform X2 [Bacillus rossius redtenbacheri]|uniref:lysosomal Pro-X carboxypeptidase isoform X2 n=1 Tax=Bacillus rossius redtenbacheri TaxID=93214 RepID=UPI002FDD582B